MLDNAILKYAKKHHINVKKYKVEIDNPKKSNVITLSAKGVLAMETAYKTIEASAVKALSQQTSGPINAYRAKIQSSLGHAKIQLAKLQDSQRVAAEKANLKQKWVSAQNNLSNLKQQHPILLKKQKSLHESAQLYGSLVTELKGYLKTARKNERSSAKKATPVNAMSSLLLGNQVQQNFQSLINMEQRLNVQIPQQEAQNQAAIQHNLQEQAAAKLAVEQAKLDYQNYTAQHQRAIQAQQITIKGLKDRLSDLQGTQMIGQPTRSVKPVGRSRKVIVVLAAFLGLFFALFVAIGTGYIAAVRRAI